MRAEEIAAALRELAEAVDVEPFDEQPTGRLQDALGQARTALYVYDQSRLPGHAY